MPIVVLSRKFLLLGLERGGYPSDYGYKPGQGTARPLEAEIRQAVDLAPRMGDAVVNREVVARPTTTIELRPTPGGAGDLVPRITSTEEEE